MKRAGIITALDYNIETQLTTNNNLSNAIPILTMFIGLEREFESVDTRQIPFEVFKK